MGMKLVKKTVEYSIYQRSDNRYAVKDANKQPVNGEDKVRILLAENLIKVAAPSAPSEPGVEASAGAPAEEAAAETDAIAEPEASAEEASAEEAPAEEPAAEASSPEEGGEEAAEDDK